MGRALTAAVLEPGCVTWMVSRCVRLALDPSSQAGVGTLLRGWSLTATQTSKCPVMV